MNKKSQSTVKSWLSTLLKSRRSERMSADNLVSLPLPMRPTARSFDGSRPETNEPPELKEKSTSSEVEIDPGTAPFAVDSPGAFQGSPDMRRAVHSNAHVVIEHSKLLPWLFLCALLSGAAIMGALWSISDNNAARREADLRQQAYEARYADLAERFRVAEREARVATERYNSVAVELARRGIPVSDH